MNDIQNYLFSLGDYPILETLELKNLRAQVWTENKANLIQRYLRYFVFITKHGTYIDTFAGPQSPDHPESWAANLVLSSDPKWLRKFVFFEKDVRKIEHLRSLKSMNAENGSRSISIYEGDMNVNLRKHLEENPIKEKEASFCLLDQHTFECHWDTVVYLAKHKKTGNKIEQFYFLAQGWLDRAMAALKEPDKDLGRWWGSDGWKTLKGEPVWNRGRVLAERFKSELGYRYSFPYPIWERDGSSGGKIMFWMIHASDHPEAPKLMVRAYNSAVAPFEPREQLEMEFAKFRKD